MTLSDSINNKRKELENLLICAQEKKKGFPEEDLYTRKMSNSIRYMKHNPGTGETQYLKKEKADEVRALEEKNYWIKLERTAKEELKTLNKVEKILEKTEAWERVFFDIPVEKRHLIKPYEAKPIEVSEEQKDRWRMLAIRYGNRNRKYLPKTSTTLNGEHVKSKSEIIIADRLKVAGVPYVYEYETVVANEYSGAFEKWYPDFKVLNTRTGKEYYWEHLGMVDKADYFATGMFKLDVFAANDIIVGDNLIVTMETAETPMNTEYIDMIIRKVLK